MTAPNEEHRRRWKVRQRKRERRAVAGHHRVPLPLAGQEPDAAPGQSRQCGGCTACCTALAIPELGKPPACDCRHKTTDGCGTYDRRPAVCRRYLCLWRLGFGTDQDRPDRSGVLLSVGGKANTPRGPSDYSLEVIELWPGAVGRRFGDPAELLRFIPKGDRCVVVVCPHGVPLAYGGPAAPEYDAFRPPPGQDRLVSAGASVQLHLGVRDPGGNLHTGHEVIPAAGLHEWELGLLQDLRHLQSESVR